MLTDWFLLVDSALKEFLLNLGLVLGPLQMKSSLVSSIVLAVPGV